MTMARAATPTSDRLVSDDIAAEQARARHVAAARRTRRRLSVIAVRAVSLAVVLLAWQLVGQRIDPILFTTPTAVASAAVQMIASG